MVEIECIPKLVITVSNCIPSSRCVYPLCIPSFKCVYHMCIPFFFIRSPTRSVPLSFVPVRLFLRHDEAVIFEAAFYSSRCASVYPVGDGQGLIPFFRDLYVSHVYPKVPACVSRVYPESKKCVSRLDVDTHYLYP